MHNEVLDLKGHLAVLEAEKHTWEEDNQNMQKRIDELNDYITPEDRLPTIVAIKDMSYMSLKDLEITQLKETNKEFKDEITTKESEDIAKEIRTLKEKVTRFEERAIGQIPLQGAKNLVSDAVIKEMPSL